MVQKIWEIKEAREIPKELIDLIGSTITAGLLVQRGIDTAEKAKDFLAPEKMKISKPDVFVDMKKSVERIDRAIQNNEKIIVYGDFDCDGVTSTALLLKTLTYLGANVSYYIPTREYENHGLNTKALVKLIAKEKAKLFITVDCAISDIEQVKFINSFRSDVIITDHHEAPEVLPDAFAILNPKAAGALDEDLPLDVIESLNCLAGVGVAFKLACALLEFYKKYDFVQELLPLVAVGTIADIVPLVGENRSFTASGLKLISSGKNAGIQKLLKIAGYAADNVNSENIAFGIAPRINAAGRLDTVESALNLLICENDAQLEVYAQTLDNYNKIRQNLSDTIFEEAIEQLQNQPPANSIILFKEDWNVGIIGIVASRLVEKFYKPVFLMTKDENTGFIRCSSRSVHGVHVQKLLEENSNLFEGFGGHAMAAGLYFDPKKTSFETVKAVLASAIDAIAAQTPFKPVVHVDMELASGDLTFDLIQEIEKLQPFGACNENPVFAVKNLTLKQFNLMGQGKNHMKIFCTDISGREFECVRWNHSKLNIPEGSKLDIAFYPKVNNFNGSSTIQLDIQDIKSESFKDDEPELKILDHRKKTGIYDQICDYLLTTKLKTAIFSENKEITETLTRYKVLGERLCDRINVPVCAQIMFFDYPPSKEVLEMICKKSQAKVLHFMNFENKKIDAEALLRKISGMLKYASNSRGGQISLNEISGFLGITPEASELCIDMFEALGMIEVSQRGSDLININFINALGYSKIKESELFDALVTELEKIYDFRELLFNCDLDEMKL